MHSKLNQIQEKNSCNCCPSCWKNATQSKYVEISTLYLPYLPCCCKPLAKQRFPVRNQPINQFRLLVAPLLHSLHVWLSAGKKLVRLSDFFLEESNSNVLKIPLHQKHPRPICSSEPPRNQISAKTPSPAASPRNCITKRAKSLNDLLERLPEQKAKEGLNKMIFQTNSGCRVIDWKFITCWANDVRPVCYKCTKFCLMVSLS